MARTVSLARKTLETDITLTLSLDGSGKADIATGIGFLDHMLTALARHALFDLTLRANGDLHIDFHHTTEDVGIVLGQAVAQALGDKRGIARFGQALVPMDEALAEVAIDISGRPVPGLGRGVRAAEDRRDGHRAVRGVLPRLRVQRADHAARGRAGPGRTRTTWPRPASRRPRARCAWRWRSTRASAMRCRPPRGRCEGLDGAPARRRAPRCWCARGFPPGRAVRPALVRAASRLAAGGLRVRRVAGGRHADRGRHAAGAGCGAAAAAGLSGHDLRRWSLARRGFTLAEVVAARNAEGAFARLLDRRHDLGERVLRADAR